MQGGKTDPTNGWEVQILELIAVVPEKATDARTIPTMAHTISPPPPLPESQAPACARPQRAQTGVGWGGLRGLLRGPLQELFQMRLAGGYDSATGGNAEPRLRQHIMASHLSRHVYGRVLYTCLLDVSV